MNLIDKQLHNIREQQRAGIMTHLVVGYPCIAVNRKLVRTMVQAGVDFIELQIPFSDPLADGPTLMHANQAALDNGIKVKDAFTFMAGCTRRYRIPFLFMTYFNIVFNYGVKRFCRDAVRAGASGLIVPDLPLEEDGSEGLQAAARRHGLYVIRVLAPAATSERLRLNARLAEGFAYFAGRQSTTGSQRELDPGLANNIKKIKRYIHTPLVVGFGVSKPAHVQALRKAGADMVVIGSAVVDTYDRAPAAKKFTQIAAYLRSLVRAAR